MNSTGCIFCDIIGGIPFREIRFENRFAIVIYDDYPVTPGHMLIIPRKHVQSYFALTTEEKVACDELALLTYNELHTCDPSIRGFNIGINGGEVAGQTISHCHIHLIPRREGDVENPRGGVRNVIPGKGDY